jgi:hypothetical protein
MLLHTTAMCQTGADLLRLASLSLATNRFREVGMNLLDAGMKVVEGAKTGQCPRGRKGPEGCRDCCMEEDSLDA